MKSDMTSLFCAFVRAYHVRNAAHPVFRDEVASKLLSPGEYDSIRQNLIRGASFFLKGNLPASDEEILARIVNRCLAPLPLARAAWSKRALENAVRLGARQFLMLGAGLDSFSLQQEEWANNLVIFEMDLPEVLADKKERIARAGLSVPENVRYAPMDFAKENIFLRLREESSFSPEKISFCSLMGLSYYLKKEDFSALVSSLSLLLPQGGAICADFAAPVSGEISRKREALAAGAGQEMKAAYGQSEWEEMLDQCGFRIPELCSPQEIQMQFLDPFNRFSPDNPLIADESAFFCLAVKAGSSPHHPSFSRH